MHRLSIICQSERVKVVSSNFSGLSCLSLPNLVPDNPPVNTRMTKEKGRVFDAFYTYKVSFHVMFGVLAEGRRGGGVEPFSNQSSR